MNSPTLTLHSFAKINCSLRIHGKRSDGYHNLVTVLQTVSLSDDLTFTPRDDEQLIVACDDSSIPLERNLVVRAGKLLQTCGARGGANIELIKRIPSTGGLGGGSSNAAITLIGLSDLWDVEGIDLWQLASQLGADVPFFLIGGRAKGEGTGATVVPLSDVDKKFLIIVSPLSKISTASAYDAWNSRSLTSARSDPILTGSLAEAISTDCDQSALHNDFEAVIFEIEPEIERAKMELLNSGADGALLAGSGSSVFGIFASEEARGKALERLNCEQGWKVFCCETLGRNDYLAQIGISESRVLSVLRKLSNTGA
ncbi:MAG TPA: 4-(cytidine 5'-diphospho)-2-C-methyl-D-erythritol kinase [Pyrinomonadaceae bacterium]|jgi:4-diphosphocytidyl-2-C-methyl-D-erythritol kinase